MTLAYLTTIITKPAYFQSTLLYYFDLGKKSFARIATLLLAPEFQLRGANGIKGQISKVKAIESGMVRDCYSSLPRINLS